MHVKIVVTNDEGQTFEGEADLAPAGTRAGRRATRARPTPGPAPAAPSPTGDTKVDFTLPRRAFLKKHATGGGPQKLAILLAHMTKGKTDVPIAREALKKEWNKSKGVLGGVAYHDMYATRATENTWIDSEKWGTFVLRADWRKALK
jgi:hypothetical protein